MTTPSQMNVWEEILQRAPTVAFFCISTNAPIRVSLPITQPYRLTSSGWKILTLSAIRTLAAIGMLGSSWVFVGILYGFGRRCAVDRRRQGVACANYSTGGRKGHVVCSGQRLRHQEPCRHRDRAVRYQWRKIEVSDDVKPSRGQPAVFRPGLPGRAEEQHGVWGRHQIA